MILWCNNVKHSAHKKIAAKNNLGTLSYKNGSSIFQLKLLWIYALFASASFFQVSNSFFVTNLIVYYKSNCSAIVFNVTIVPNSPLFAFDWLVSNGTYDSYIARISLESNGKIFKSDFNTNDNQIEVSVPSKPLNTASYSFFSSLTFNNLKFNRSYEFGLVSAFSSLRFGEIFPANCTFPPEIYSTSSYDDRPNIVCDLKFGQQCVKGTGIQFNVCTENLTVIDRIAECKNLDSTEYNENEKLSALIINLLLASGLLAIAFGTIFLYFGLWYSYDKSFRSVVTRYEPEVWKDQGLLAIGCGLIICGIGLTVCIDYKRKGIGILLILIGGILFCKIAMKKINAGYANSRPTRKLLLNQKSYF